MISVTLSVGGQGLVQTGYVFILLYLFFFFYSTLQSIPQQRVQLWVKLCLLLQHVKEQLVLCGAGNFSLLQSALHHLHLRLPLSCLQALKRSDHSVRPFHLHFISFFG